MTGAAGRVVSSAAKLTGDAAAKAKEAAGDGAAKAKEAAGDAAAKAKETVVGSDAGVRLLAIVRIDDDRPLSVERLLVMLVDAVRGDDEQRDLSDRDVLKAAKKRQRRAGAAGALGGPVGLQIASLYCEAELLCDVAERHRLELSVEELAAHLARRRAHDLAAARRRRRRRDAGQQQPDGRPASRPPREDLHRGGRAAARRRAREGSRAPRRQAVMTRSREPPSGARGPCGWRAASRSR
ncbi:MAG: hypothetical protein QOC64_2650 [Solirubrobacteraceae bacterium]|jgi:hypothetical protein|nr:hypothetical protein [Solirubrobacteraceae bacterium]